MTDSIDEALIDRYVAGECSQDEIDRVEAWIGTDPARRDRVERARALWQAVRARNDQWNVDRAWARVRDEVHARPPTGQSRDSERAHSPAELSRTAPQALGSSVSEPSQSSRRRGVMVAAAVVLLGISLVTWRIVVARQGDRSTSEAITTGPGQRVDLRLPDGTRVVLGPGSRLVHASRFGERAREVALDGAGYFDVVHDALRPFVVVVDGLRVRDLGTQFAIEAYMRDSDTSGNAQPIERIVAVTGGSVDVESVTASGKAAPDGPGRSAARPAVRIQAGSVGHIDPQGRVRLERPANIGRYVGWTSGVLVFDDVPLRDVVPRLQHWYGVTILLGDPDLACRHVTVTVRDESLKDVLAEISLALHVRTVWSGGSVTMQVMDRKAPAIGADSRGGAAAACPQDSAR